MNATQRRVVFFLTAAMATLLAMAALFGNVLRSQDVDPQYTRAFVERAIHYGGTFYANGIHNKGPLGPAVYTVASWITTYDAFWYAISLFVVVASLVLAVAAARTAALGGGTRSLNIAAGVAFFVHLTLSGADYAGVLYDRNIVAPLLGAAWVLIVSDWTWTGGRKTRWALGGIGVLLGLAVQTIVTTAVTGGVLLAVAVAACAIRFPEGRERTVALRTVVGAAAVAFFSAPAYYAVRGSWAEFWASWWTQARYMSVGTGRSLGNQLGLGVHKFFDYYQARPLAALVVVLFALYGASAWRTADVRVRLVYVGLLAWFLGAWVELAISQRYSSHYFIVSTLPTALMAAFLAGVVYRLIVAERGRPLAGEVALPLVVAILAVFLFEPKYTTDGLRVASRFTSPRAAAVEAERNLGGKERSVLAMLDLVTHRGDPLLMWTNEAWPYLKYERTPATRFIWKSFLTGEIYLGRTSPQYVVPRAWAWFAEDMAEADPRVFVEMATPVQNTPFDTFVRRNFEPVFKVEDQTVYLRRRLAGAVLAGTSPGDWTPPSAGSTTGWTVSGNDVSLTDPATDAALVLADRPCVRLQGMSAGPVRFQFSDLAGRAERLHLTLDADKVTAGSDFVDYISVPLAPSPAREFAVVVGRRAAALVVDGQVRGALRLEGNVSMDVVDRGAPVTLSDLRSEAVTGAPMCG